MQLNIEIIKEFLILIMGPIFQIISYLVLLKIIPENEEVIKVYHYGILFFNLLPIYPLDGGKLLNIVLSLIIPYKKSYRSTLIISYFMVLLIFLLNKDNITINLIIVILFLIYKITKEYKNIEYLYQRFILERYLNKYNLKKSVIINNINNFYRNKRHLIKVEDKYFLEKEILNKIYKKNKKSVDNP